jgi:hypothetical protein
MKLPNARSAKVERKKITEYLLNREHPDNGGKAVFFVAFGFHRDDWQPLAEAIRKLAVSHSVTLSMESTHGKKYIVDGTMETPTGKSPRVRLFGLLTAEKLFPGW